MKESPELVNRFLMHLGTTKGKSMNTVDGYRNNLNMFFEFMINYKNNLKLQDISEIDITGVNLEFIKSIVFEDLEQYMFYLQNRRSNSNNTRARQTAALKSFYKYLEIKAKLIKENPTRELDSPKAEKRNPIYLNEEECKLLIKTAEKEVKNGTRNAIRDFCILTLLLETGMRRAELDSLDLSTIREDVAKTIGKGNLENTKYLNKKCLKAIEDYLKIRPTEGIKAGDEDALFLSEQKKRMNLKSIGDVVKKYATLSGVNKDKKITCHKLRHTYATNMTRKGEDILVIQELLNHKNVSTTQIYTHLDVQKLRDAVNR